MRGHKWTGRSPKLELRTQVQMEAEAAVPGAARLRSFLNDGVL